MKNDLPIKRILICFFFAYVLVIAFENREEVKNKPLKASENIKKISENSTYQVLPPEVSDYQAPPPEVFDKLYSEYEKGNRLIGAGKHAEAFSMLRPLAEKGYAPAQYGIGFLYFYGLGLSKDKNKAEKWFRKSAAQGNGHAKYFIDNYIDEKTKAHRYYKILQTKGAYRETEETIEAKFRLAMMYLNGDGVPQSDKTAYMWFFYAQTEFFGYYSKYFKTLPFTGQITENITLLNKRMSDYEIGEAKGFF